MDRIIGALGALQVFGGILVFIWAPTAIQEILGAVLFGMGVMAIGLGSLIDKAAKQLAIFDKLGKPKA